MSVLAEGLNCGTSVVGVPDAPLASDNPAAPNAGTAFFSFVSWIALCLTWHARPFVCAIYATAPHDIEQVTKKSGDRGDPVAIKAAVEVVISAARQ